MQLSQLRQESGKGMSAVPEYGEGRPGSTLPRQVEPSGRSARSGQPARSMRLARSARPKPLHHPFARCIFNLALALVLAVGLIPLSPVVFKDDPSNVAEAYVGTSEYSKLFRYTGIAAGGGSGINGNTFICGDKNNNSLNNHVSEHFWQSDGRIASLDNISLMHDWNISASLNLPRITVGQNYSWIHENFHIGFGSSQYYVELTVDATKERTESYISTRRWSDYAILKSTPINWSLSSRPSIYINYDSESDTLSFTVSDWSGSKTHSVNGFRATSSSHQTIFLGGNYGWRHKYHSDSDPKPPNIDKMYFTFNNINLPHLNPTTESVAISNEAGIQLNANDDVEPGTILKVTASFKNGYYSPGTEQFPMHVRMPEIAGMSPVVDRSHPVSVNGSAVTYSLNEYSPQGSVGIPITLNGSNATTVTFYVKTTNADGASASMKVRLIEDYFKGSIDSSSIYLLNEKPLALDTANAGANCDVGRTPANGNGWNAGPVTINFNDRTYDRLTVKNDIDSTSKVLTAVDSSYVVGEDMSGAQLTFQASRPSADGTFTVNSVTKSDVIRIDTHAPTLSFDPATLTLGASDDTGGAPAATSGIWKIVRADAQDAAPRDARDGVVLNEVSDRRWPTETTLTNPYPGRYVAMDAAGNVCAEVEVPAYGAPAVSRPEAPSPDEGDGGSEGDGYAGPVFDTDVPECQVETDGFGLRHASVREDVHVDVDADSPEFGGSLTKDMAAKISEHNYAFAPDEDEEDKAISVKVELIDGASGNAIDSVDTKRTSIAIIRTTATDAQGNTATSDLTYTFINEGELPTVTPKPGKADPKDPFGALIVTGNEKAPATLPVKDVEIDYGRTGATGRAQLNGTVDSKVSLPGQKDPVTKVDVERLIGNRFEFGSAVSPDGITASQVVIYDPEGNPVDEIDLSKPGRWTAVKTLTDSNGNVTTFNLTIEKKRVVAALPEEGAPPITPSTDIRLDPDRTNTVDGTPYFEHDAENPVNILDAIQARSEGKDVWSAIAGGAGSGDGSGSGNGGGAGDGTGSGNGSDPTNPDDPDSPDGSGDGGGAGSGSGDGTGSGSGETGTQLPGNVKVTVTDECGRPVDPTSITDPGTYEVTVSVKEPDTDEYIIIETLTFHIVDTSITDTDWIYKDVPKGHWGHGYIFDVGPAVINGAFNPSGVALGYMAGYAGTTDFGPGNGIIRGDAAIVIWRMAGCPEVEGDEGADDLGLLSLANTHYTGFTDCDANPTMYYNKAISWCAQNGIVEGYGDTGEYRPQSQITREEFASIIARYAGFKGKDVSATSADLSQYPDIQDVSDWALPNMEYVVASGIMTGKGTDEGTAVGPRGILDPQAHVTRAEVAKMAYIEQPEKL